MRPRAHLAAGALVSVAAAPRLGGSLRARPTESVVFGALACNLPDFDLFLPALTSSRFYELDRRGGSRHHNWITHSPAVWAVTIGAGWAAARAADRCREDELLTELAELTGICIATHLAQDSISDALPLLWPLSKRRIGLRLGRIGLAIRRPEPGWGAHPRRRDRQLLRGLLSQALEIRSDARSWSARYADSPSARIELALTAAAVAAIAWRVIRRGGV